MTEARIQRAGDVVKGRTSFVVAHRLSTIGTPTWCWCSTTARSWSAARTGSCCDEWNLRRPVPGVRRLSNVIDTRFFACCNLALKESDVKTATCLCCEFGIWASRSWPRRMFGRIPPLAFGTMRQIGRWASRRPTHNRFTSPMTFRRLSRSILSRPVATRHDDCQQFVPVCTWSV